MRQKDSLFKLFDLKTQEVRELTHHTYLILRLHLFHKVVHHGLGHPTKHYVIHIDLSEHHLRARSLDKESLIIHPSDVSLLSEIFYKALVPYKAL